MTTLKTLLAAAALVTVPSLAMAQSCSWMKNQTASQSCAPGTSWDATAGVCTPDATG